MAFVSFVAKTNNESENGDEENGVDRDDGLAVHVIMRLHWI